MRTSQEESLTDERDALEYLRERLIPLLEIQTAATSIGAEAATRNSFSSLFFDISIIQFIFCSRCKEISLIPLENQFSIEISAVSGSHLEKSISQLFLPVEISDSVCLACGTEGDLKMFHRFQNLPQYLLFESRNQQIEIPVHLLVPEESFVQEGKQTRSQSRSLKEERSETESDLEFYLRKLKTANSISQSKLALYGLRALVLQERLADSDSSRYSALVYNDLQEGTQSPSASSSSRKSASSSADFLTTEEVNSVREEIRNLLGISGSKPKRSGQQPATRGFALKKNVLPRIEKMTADNFVLIDNEKVERVQLNQVLSAGSVFRRSHGTPCLLAFCKMGTFELSSQNLTFANLDENLREQHEALPALCRNLNRKEDLPDFLFKYLDSMNRQNLVRLCIIY